MPTPLQRNLTGALWILGTCVAASTNALLVKLLGGQLHAFEIAFLRCVTAIAILAPIIFARGGIAAFHSRAIHSQLARGAFAGVGMMAAFYGFTQLPLALAVSLQFTKPLWVLILAAVLLRYRVGWSRGIATLVAFVGIVIAAGPEMSASPTPLLAMLAMLGAAVCMASTNLLVRNLSVDDPPIPSVLFLTLVCGAIAAVPAILVWRTPDAKEWLLLCGCGAVSSIAQYCTIRGLRLADVTVATPVEYSQIVIAALYGYLIFSEQPGLPLILGAALIVGSTLFILHNSAPPRRPLALRRRH
jgi:drug/metabolite transporter (DMT)-like permease